MIARKAILNQTASNILRTIGNQPKISPLKQALTRPGTPIRPKIQIQKSIQLPKASIKQNIAKKNLLENIPSSNELKLCDLSALNQYPILSIQLRYLNIIHVHHDALQIILEHPEVFTQGLIPNNLPKGFYIDPDQRALCYNNNPLKLPSALAPGFELPAKFISPSIETITSLFPQIDNLIVKDLKNSDLAISQQALESLLSAEVKDEFTLFFKKLDEAIHLPKSFQLNLIDQFILGGESHALLLIRLITDCTRHKIDTHFLNDPYLHAALLTTQGVKNLQKLNKLTSEQIAWWNALTQEHRANKTLRYFDFNIYFEAYTTCFLPRVSKLNLTLPTTMNSSGICQSTVRNQQGHFLLTLNRVIDVLEHAADPKAQCLALKGLNWGALGVHYAMLGNPEPNKKFKFVHAIMELQYTSDTEITPEQMEKLLASSSDLKMLLYRYIGQHWKINLQFSDIQEKFQQIDQLVGWSSLQRKQLCFIVACTFANDRNITAIQFRNTVDACIELLQPLISDSERSYLLTDLTRCYKFKPCPSLPRLQLLIEQCIELKSLKDIYPLNHFGTEILDPLLTCLEEEGDDFYCLLLERIKKTMSNSQTDEIKRAQLIAQMSLIRLLKTHRQTIVDARIKIILVKLNEAELTEQHLKNLTQSFQNLEQLKPHGELILNALLELLAEINISKSQTIPLVANVIAVVERLADASNTIHLPHEPIEQVETLKTWLADNRLLNGCVFGHGDISKLDDLIVDALVDSVMKRRSLLKIDGLKEQVLESLNTRFLPIEVQNKLKNNLGPFFDALNQLVIGLQRPNPQFDELMGLLSKIELAMPILMDDLYHINLMGETSGSNLLSILLTGKRNPDDKATTSRLEMALKFTYKMIIDRINDPINQFKAKDLEASQVIKWLEQFSDYHSISFVFTEELVHKKIVPALKKVLHALNIEDPSHVIEKSMMEVACSFDDKKAAHTALIEYKTKIEGVTSYLNALIDIKKSFELKVFNEIMTQLHTGTLGLLEFSLKKDLINLLIRYIQNEDLIKKYLTQIAIIIEANGGFTDSIAISRAIAGLESVFKIDSFNEETRCLFMSMSVRHNLKSASIFPLESLNRFNQFQTKSHKQAEVKSSISTQLIQLLSKMTEQDASDLISQVIKATEVFLKEFPDDGLMCLSLLKRVCVQSMGRDLSFYINLLHQMSLLPEAVQSSCIIIVTGLANNKKDDTANIQTIKDIMSNLSRRSADDLVELAHLFETPPYPLPQELKKALLKESDKFKAYCQEFDRNPYAKMGELRPLNIHFSTDRVLFAINSLRDMIDDVPLPHALQLKLARQVTYIQTLGYIDPLNPLHFDGLKKLTNEPRHELKSQAVDLLNRLRNQTMTNPEELEHAQLKLLATLREIYFRLTGSFLNTTQVLILLMSLQDKSSNLLMRIKTGEGKSFMTPMLAVLQWMQGGTVDVCTANKTLLERDYINHCEPFFVFLNIPCAMIQSHSPVKAYQGNGINCSTLEDIALFRLSAKEFESDQSVGEHLPIHLILDECDDALLDQTTLFKLVAEKDDSPQNGVHTESWLYSFAYEFIHLPAFRNINPLESAWDEEEDLEQFRFFLTNKVDGDAHKQHILMATSNLILKQCLHATCEAAILMEDQHFVIQPIKAQDAEGNIFIESMRCVPLVRSIPKSGCIFTDGVQQALQARLCVEHAEQERYFKISPEPHVLASQSASGVVKFYQSTHGRLLGMSGTPGDPTELQYLNSLLGTRAIEISPFAGDKRTAYPAVFTFSRDESLLAIQTMIDKIKHPVTRPSMYIDDNDDIPDNYDQLSEYLKQRHEARQKWRPTQTQPILVICEDFNNAKTVQNFLNKYKSEGYKIQLVTGKEGPIELDKMIKNAGEVNTITIGTAMLARGIDISPQEHPDGLLVIQTYPDSERMTTQIEGRAARNGKPGQWLPIYEVNPPTHWFIRLIHYLFSFFRQRFNERAIKNLQDNIKRQGNAERIYTQSIAQIQDILMQNILAWENLLLEINPSLKQELYNWRQILLVEISYFQATSVSLDNYRAAIEQFKLNIIRSWENAREEKWSNEVKKSHELSIDQQIKFDYLSTRDLAQEFNIQTPLQRETRALRTGLDELMNHKLISVIANKAGATLHYNRDDLMSNKLELELSQTKQLLPQVIVDLCDLDPKARGFYLANNDVKLPKHSTREQVKQFIFESYQIKLNTKKLLELQNELIQLKDLILQFEPRIKYYSIYEQFKMQSILKMLSELYVKSDLVIDDHIARLLAHYDRDVMKTLATFLMNEFAWANKISAVSIGGLFETDVVKQAAHNLYLLAHHLSLEPNNKVRIQEFYKALCIERLNVKDSLSISLFHRSVKSVIQDVLDAIDSLAVAPHCDKSFREECYDHVLSHHQIIKFRHKLFNLSKQIKTQPDTVWTYLVDNLEQKIDSADEDTISTILELHAAVERFIKYKSYQPYLTQLNQLKTHLQKALNELQNSDGLKQNIQENFLKKEASQFSRLFCNETAKTANHQVYLRAGTDLMDTFYDLQIQDQPAIDGFVHYRTSNSMQQKIDQDRKKLEQLKEYLIKNEEALIELEQVDAINGLPLSQKEAFNRLFEINRLLKKQATRIQWLEQFSQSDLFKDLHPEIQHDMNAMLAILKQGYFDGQLGINIARQRELQEKIKTDQATSNNLSRETNELKELIDNKILLEKDRNFFQRLNAFFYWTSEEELKLKEKEGELSILHKNILEDEQELSILNLTLNKQCEDLFSKIQVDLKNDIQHKAKIIIEQMQQTFSHADQIIDQIFHDEKNKSRYQTKRFFSPDALLEYQAQLEHEEERIPAVASI